MYFDSIADLLQMGKHGFYVWWTYGVSVLTLLFLGLYPLRKNSYLKQQLRQQMRREALHSQQSSEQEPAKSEAI